jgi:hypothetical protein
MSRLHRARTEKAQATILSVHDPKFLIDGNPYSGGGRTPIGERIRVRVKPEGGSEFESEAKVRAHSSFAVENRETYVLYDPDAPDRCDIDYERLEQEFGRTELTCFPAPDPVPDSPDAPSSTPESDSAEEDPIVAGLTQIDVLHKTGGLSDAEFAAAKARLLGATDPGA